jgi:hypothetical protein
VYLIGINREKQLKSAGFPEFGLRFVIFKVHNSDEEE